MVDLVKEVKLLKYQNKLLQTMVNGDDFLFFMFTLNHDLDETQVNSILKILNVFAYRLKENSDEKFEDFSKQNISDRDMLNELGIDVDHLYKNELPNIKEFESYIRILCSQDFEIKYLLLSLTKQEIHSEVCNYLLGQLN
ncbi:DUF1878 family protein [Bacillus cytotoxicus]|uniref:DUF1878 domain-containing protein n=1 Tax=Bacillus cytotoxicus TaxID=580165 RepID=A0AAX2CNS7_9BACI|nr:DUF1878 family protein [Bacillus cytotoxicus]QTR81091.1 DUF1878 family protein [Bacillus cytotoxicus]QTR85195.1 DUF1878 family protein [Bacillus cytotoxicus]SCM08221.1 Uncharacterized protein BCB44BAC_04551 [Bacillus cytotoxicus]